VLVGGFTYKGSTDQADTLARNQKNAGHKVVGCRMEIEDASQRAAVLDLVRERFGQLDALVNNAAVFPARPWPRSPCRRWS